MSVASEHTGLWQSGLTLWSRSLSQTAIRRLTVIIRRSPMSTDGQLAANARTAPTVS